MKKKEVDVNDTKNVLVIHVDRLLSLMFWALAMGFSLGCLLWAGGWQRLTVGTIGLVISFFMILLNIFFGAVEDPRPRRGLP